MPALLIRPVMGPFAAIAAIVVRRASSSHTSQAYASPAVALPLRESAATAKPRRTRSAEIADPIPRLAPVTKIVPSGIAKDRFAFLAKCSHAFLSIGGTVGKGA